MAGYDHYAVKQAPYIEACSEKYLEDTKLLERCEVHAPYSGAALRMGILTFVGILGVGGSIGFSLNTVRRADDERPLY